MNRIAESPDWSRVNAKHRLDDQLDSLIKISIEYPYLENERYTSCWTSKHDGDDKNVRYTSYCILLFNYLYRICNYFNYDKDQVDNYVRIGPWVRSHRKYWEDPSEIHDRNKAYGTRFIDFINDYLD